MEAVPEPVNERIRQAQERVAPQLEQARRSAADLNQRVVTFIRQNPGTCLIGAVALGYLVGRIASRD
ncbi:MAG TPA: hypothetical protein VK013_11680 [Myxococcaceae bacterium]|nr:hypothetical protein [Myxococcaceae bacterium]